MICVTYSGTAVVFQDPQPATITDETCTYVLQKPSEIERSPFVLTTEQGSQIGMSIMLACAIAWGFRLIAKSFFSKPIDSEE